MKKHAIIPIFIPHRGCPNDCVFCNQRTITARSGDVSADDVRHIADQWLTTLTAPRPDVLEMAFFGGSFTGIPIEQQNEYLSVAYDYKKRGLIDRIHMSTRPDYIDERILANLQDWSVDVIELGVQSFDENVLEASKRGHSVDAVYRACSLIMDHGFELGIQLMVGLPHDSREKDIFSAKETVKIGPSIARIYPTVVLENTELADMYRSSAYRPLTEEEAVSITADMYRILDSAGINIIRVGLKSTDLINEDSDLGGGYHPAFRQLVEGRLAREDMEKLLRSAEVRLQNDTCDHSLPADLTFYSSSRSFSSMIGHHACNKKHFAAELIKDRSLKIRYEIDKTLSDGTYAISIAGGPHIMLK